MEDKFQCSACRQWHTYKGMSEVDRSVCLSFSYWCYTQ